MIEIKKTWETVFFTASNKSEFSSTVELSWNRDSGKYTISQAHEEGVRFDTDSSIEKSELKVKAIQAAIKYIKEQIK